MVAIDFGGRSDEMTIWLPRAVQVVERVEELLLELLGALEELDVVDEEHVDLAVAAFERRACASSASRRRTRSSSSRSTRSERACSRRASRTWWPIACSRWVFPSPAGP